MPKIIPVQYLEDSRNKVSSLNGAFNDDIRYPSAKAVKEYVSTHAATNTSYEDEGKIDADGNFTWGTLSNGGNSYTLYINGHGALPDNRRYLYKNTTTKTLHTEWDEHPGFDVIITKIVIGDNITHIGKRMFKGAVDASNNPKGTANVTEVIFGKNVTTMSYECFQDCVNLEKVTLNEGLTMLGSNTFKGCTSLNNVIIPSTVKSINNSAFNGCSQLNNIIIPDTVESIQKSVFDGSDCYNTSDWINNNELYIGNHLIKYNGEAETYTVRNGTRTIAGEAFKLPNDGNGDEVSNTTLKEVVIPDSVVCIGEGAFYNCSNLTNVTIDDHTTIGDNAFSGTSESLQYYWLNNGFKYTREDNGKTACIVGHIGDLKGYLEIPPSFNEYRVTKIGGSAFKGNSNITGVDIPDSVTLIDNNAFFNCTSVRSVSMSQTISQINGGAFSYIPIKSVQIPNTLTTISTTAFSGCENLNNVYYMGTPEQWGNVSNINSAFSSDSTIYYLLTESSIEELVNEKVNEKIQLYSTAETIPTDLAEGTIIFTYSDTTIIETVEE